MWVVAIAFVGLMVFNWGRDISGESARKGKKNEVGRVNKQSITLREYQNAYRNALRRYSSSGQTITNAIEENIRQSAFLNLVQTKLLMNKAEAYNVDEVSALELYQNIRRNPPEFLRNAEAFQTNGKFDYSKFQAALRDPNQPWEQIEAMVKADLPFQKLRQVVQLMAYVSPAEVRQAYQRKADSVKVEYAKLGPWALVDFTADTSEQALKEYYEQNKDRYKRDEKKAVLDYIQLPVPITSRDSALARETIYNIYEDLKEGEDFSYLAKAYSEDYRTARQGGDMGFFPENMLEGKFDSVFASLDTSEFSEPFIEGYGWHIVKLIETQGEKDSLLLHGAHIMVQIQAEQTTRDSVRSLAEKIWNWADSLGLKKAVEKTGRDDIKLLTTAPFARNGYIDGVGKHPELNAFAFSQDTTSRLFRVIPTTEALYIYQFKKILPAGYPPLEEISEKVEGDMILDQKKEYMEKLLDSIYTQWTKKDAPFSKLASQYRYRFEIDTTIYFTRDSYLNEPSADPIFKAYAFKLKEKGEVSPPFVDDIGDGYILRLIDRKLPDWENFTSQQKEQLRAQLYQEKRQQIYNKWFEHLLSNSTIQDFRGNYY